jgi:uncharacterized membrane protein
MKFIKTTIIGGLVFMVPVVIVVAVVGKALKIMMLVAKPLDRLIPADSIGGIAIANVLALLAVALCCFIAGVIARSSVAKKAYRSIDTALLAVPGYAFVKGFTESMNSSEEDAKSLIPVIVRFDDNARSVSKSNAQMRETWLSICPEPRTPGQVRLLISMRIG